MERTRNIKIRNNAQKNAESEVKKYSKLAAINNESETVFSRIFNVMLMRASQTNVKKNS